MPISEGALANLFKRVKPRFDEQATAIKQRVLDSPIVCSDETSARVEGLSGISRKHFAATEVLPTHSMRCRHQATGDISVRGAR